MKHFHCKKNVLQNMNVLYEMDLLETAFGTFILKSLVKILLTVLNNPGCIFVCAVGDHYSYSGDGYGQARRDTGLLQTESG